MREKSCREIAAAEAVARGQWACAVGRVHSMCIGRHRSACRDDLRAVERVERYRKNGLQAVECGSKVRYRTTYTRIEIRVAQLDRVHAGGFTQGITHTFFRRFTAGGYAGGTRCEYESHNGPSTGRAARCIPLSTIGAESCSSLRR